MSDRYEILGKLARGGIGAIYRATDTVMKREVAIKRLLPLEETHLNEAADESLEREAAALARFQHPNVVTIYAFEDDDEGSYVVMELVEGENLKETIERGALPIEDFRELVLQTLDPMIAAKDMNLLHRDIKPSNIMLTWLRTGKFQVKVLDFGLAKFSQAPSTQTLDQTGSFLGSIDYLAPEQLELAPLDQRTDLYSLGCVLYFCLTQKPPFEGKNSGETIQNHLKQNVTPIRELRSDLSPAVAAWVMRMISRYPNQRPEDARAALREFEAALDGVMPIGSKASAEPVVEVVEELPVAEIAAADPTPTAKRVESAASRDPVPTAKRAESPPAPILTRASQPATAPTASQPVQRPKLNTAPVKKAPEPSQVTKAAAAMPARKITATRKSPSSEPASLKKPVIALVCALVAALVVLIILLGPNGDDDSGNEGQSANPASSGKPKSNGSRGKAKGKGNSNSKGPSIPSLPTVHNSTEPFQAPPPVTAGLVAHYRAGERCLDGKQFDQTAKPGKRIRAWGNLAAGAAPTHLLTVDAAHQDKGPQLKQIGPDKRPELNGTHFVLAFRNIDRLISQADPSIEAALAGTEWTNILVFRNEANWGQIIRFMDDTLPSRLLKIEGTANAGKIRSVMTRGTLRPSAETALDGGKGKFVIFTHIWSGDEFGEQHHHLVLPGKKRKAGKPGNAPHKNMRLSPARYALGATGPETAESYQDNNGETKQEGTGGFSGEVAEWLIYDRVLTADERKKIEDHLYDRYFAK